MSLTNRTEFKSRTQVSIRRLCMTVLETRAKGHQATLEAIDLGAQGNVFGDKERSLQRELIASLNYSRSQASKELAVRVKELKALNQGKVVPFKSKKKV